MSQEPRAQCPNFKRFKRKQPPAPKEAQEPPKEDKDFEFESDLFRRLSYSFEF